MRIKCPHCKELFRHYLITEGDLIRNTQNKMIRCEHCRGVIKATITLKAIDANDPKRIAAVVDKVTDEINQPS